MSNVRIIISTHEETSSNSTRDGDQLNVSREQVALSLLEVERVDLGTLSNLTVVAVNITINL